MAASLSLQYLVSLSAVCALGALAGCSSSDSGGSPSQPAQDASAGQEDAGTDAPDSAAQQPDGPGQPDAADDGSLEDATVPPDAAEDASPADGAEEESSPGNDASDSAPDAPLADDVSVYDIQTPGGSHSAVGGEVTLRGVVVTAIDSYGNSKGSIFVEEPAGGPYSGVLVFHADLNVVASLEVGDLVDVEQGIVDEFALVSDTTGRTTTQIAPVSGGNVAVTKVGHLTPLAPAVVDPVLVAQDDQEAEKWEGVLVRFEQVAILQDLAQVGSDPTLKRTHFTGPLVVDSSLASIDALVKDECLASLTGVLDYFFEYTLHPRASEDIVDGSGCVLENSEALCANSLDDDHDGTVDCLDTDCAAFSGCTP